jgi:serine/threonine-protein kinase
LTACPNCRKESPEGSRFCPFCGTKLLEAAKARRDPLLNLTVDGKYQVMERIGSGAMGSIYKAEHLTLSKTVVLKVLHKHLVREDQHVKRFHREARAASRLNHPNCISVLDFGQTGDGWFYIAMEYLPGRDLCRVLFEDGAMPPRRAAHIGSQVLDALDEAHSNGIVHRDLKPENIMVQKLRSDPEFVKVLDFGIAKIRDQAGHDPSSFKTATGMVFGTPEYMSPEQIRGEELDGGSDLYSLGVVLYQILSGDLPFQGDSVLEVATQHLSQPPAPLETKRPDLPPALCAVVMKLLSKKRADRYPSAAEARKALLASVADADVRDGAPPAGQRGKDVYTRTTTKVPLPDGPAGEAISDEPEARTCVLDAPPTFPTNGTKRVATFRNLMLLLLVLVLAGGLTFGIAAFLPDILDYLR